MAFAEQMALRSFSFEVTAWTRAGCFLIPRCIALHLLVWVVYKICCIVFHMINHLITWPRMSWYSIELSIHFYSICGFQGTYLTDIFISHLQAQTSLNPRITGKNQLYGTALPCWSRLTHSSRSYPSQASPLSRPIGTCPFYIKHSFEWSLFFFRSGSHLLSHTVSSIVPSAA